MPAASQLSLGELAINTADGACFLKKTDGTVVDLTRPAIIDGGEISSTPEPPE